MNRRIPRSSWQSVIAACLVLLMAPTAACAHGGAHAATAARAPELHGNAALEDVLSGIAGFEARAKAYSADEWNFVLGYAHFMAGRWSDADRSFEKVADRLPELRDDVLYYRAACANRLGRFADALRLLDELRDASGDSIWSQRGQVERATALAGLKRFAEATRILSSAESAAGEEDRPEIQQLLVRTLIDAGDCTRAAGKLESLAMDAQGERDLADLAPLMDDAKSRCREDVRRWLAEPAQELRLVQSFVAHSEWADAATRLEKLLSGKSLDGTGRTHAQWLLARCYRWTHRYDEAIALMEGLRKNPASEGFSEDLLGTLATTYTKKNDYAQALAIRQGMMDRLPPHSAAAARIAFKIAFLHMDQGKYAEAIPLWERAAGMAGGHERLMARWYIGWCHYMRGEFAEAAEAFDELIRSGARSGGIDDRAEFWKARALLRMKREGEANAIFRRLEEEHAGGYYGELAHKSLAGIAAAPDALLAVDGEWPQARAWKEEASSAGDSSHLAKARLLDRLGLHEEVGQELRALEGRGDPALMLWLASRNFAHDIAYRIARTRYGALLKGTPSRDPFEHFVWEQAYPRAYEPAMQLLARQEGVDPVLAWSIMLNESNFKPHALSPAGAVGLMQLMPTTAGKVALERGGTEPARRELLHPLVNISYGMAYLGKLAKLFPGNEVAQIAAYNAGEEAVARWLKNGSYNHIEEWIEEIPYDETNLYVKKVLTSYWKYKRLYGEAP